MDKATTFKEVMGNYPTGVTVCTTTDEQGTPLGLTVNSFASVSLDPLLILWSIDKGASSHDPFVKAKKFAVNILAGDQADVCSLFATRGSDRFSQCEWAMSDNELPVLAGTAGVMECETYQAIDAGDHTIFIGKVINIENNKKEPLLYHKRKFGEIPEEFYK